VIYELESCIRRLVAKYHS
jgi:hypothetical protein